MRIAVPLFGKDISPRFRYADRFLLVAPGIAGGAMGRFIEPGCASVTQRLVFLGSLGVTQILCCGFDKRFLPFAKRLGIRVSWGLHGNAGCAVRAFMAGAATDIQPLDSGESAPWAAGIPMGAGCGADSTTEEDWFKLFSINTEEMPMTPSTSSRVSRESLAEKRILVVDDEEDARLFLSMVFQDAGATVFVAGDGDEALAIARQEKPDLITLDLSMPGKDGVDAFAELRSDPVLAEIPVCVVTGHPEFRKVIYSRTVPPPEGFMNKPVDEKNLLRNARRILALKEKKSP